jgi:subtilisin
MRRVATWVMAGACAVSGACLSPAPAGADQTRRPFIVVYDSQPADEFPVQRETAARERVFDLDSERLFRHAVDGFAARLTARAADSLRRDPEVALVARDRELHTARIALAGGETVPTGVARIGARTEAGVHEPSAAAVAVLDTGVDLGDPDLNVRAGPNCAGSGPPADDNGHGTAVAGMIGARNDGAGVVGVAPGTELYAVKVLGWNGVGLVSEIVCGIDWVTAHGPALGIRVVNMSLSEPYPATGCAGDALHLAVCQSVLSGMGLHGCGGQLRGGPRRGDPRVISRGAGRHCGLRQRRPPGRRR